MRAHCPTGRDARSQGFAGSAPAGGWELWNCAVVLHGLCHGPKSKGRMRKWADYLSLHSQTDARGLFCCTAEILAVHHRV